MGGDDTRALTQRYLDARTSQDHAAVDELLADKVEWIRPSSLNGSYVGKDAVLAALRGGPTSQTDFSTIRRNIHRVIVEGDTAVVLQRNSSMTRDGKQYVNDYCFVYTWNDGRIIRMDEYLDTWHAAQIFGWLDQPGGEASSSSS